MSMIEKKRFELEIIKVNTAKAEMEFKILERQEDINRIKKEIENQDKRIKELELLISKLKGD